MPQSQGGRFSLYKQEAENHWHTVACLIVPGGGAGPASRLCLPRPPLPISPRAASAPLPAPLAPFRGSGDTGSLSLKQDLQGTKDFIFAYSTPPFHVFVRADGVEMVCFREAPKSQSHGISPDLGGMEDLCGLTSPAGHRWNKSQGPSLCSVAFHRGSTVLEFAARKFCVPSRVPLGPRRG